MKIAIMITVFAVIGVLGSFFYAADRGGGDKVQLRTSSAWKNDKPTPVLRGTDDWIGAQMNAFHKIAKPIFCPPFCGDSITTEDPQVLLNPSAYQRERIGAALSHIQGGELITVK
jgi:hypothetical protein